jgi:hypothetical protein
LLARDYYKKRTAEPAKKFGSETALYVGGQQKKGKVEAKGNLNRRMSVATATRRDIGRMPVPNVSQMKRKTKGEGSANLTVADLRDLGTREVGQVYAMTEGTSKKVDVFA